MVVSSWTSQEVSVMRSERDFEAGSSSVKEGGEERRNNIEPCRFGILKVGMHAVEKGGGFRNPKTKY